MTMIYEISEDRLLMRQRAAYIVSAIDMGEPTEKILTLIDGIAQMGRFAKMSRSPVEPKAYYINIGG